MEILNITINFYFAVNLQREFFAGLLGQAAIYKDSRRYDYGTF